MEIVLVENHYLRNNAQRMQVLLRLFSVVLCLIALGCATSARPLATLPLSSPNATQHNLAGIQEYHKGNWEVAKRHFEAAVRADQDLPEAHFNLALSLHELNAHEEATSHFKRAGELDPENKEIIESSLYRNHMGISSTLERHMTGGYRY